MSNNSLMLCSFIAWSVRKVMFKANTALFIRYEHPRLTLNSHNPTFCFSRYQIWVKWTVLKVEGRNRTKLGGPISPIFWPHIYLRIIRWNLLMILKTYFFVHIKRLFGLFSELLPGMFIHKHWYLHCLLDRFVA